MLTRFYLHIDSEQYLLKEDDLNNWADIRCTLKRKELDSVIRSFTSEFEFVNEARRILLDLYLESGFSAVAEISIAVSDDRWNYEEKYRAPLDFSTISWDSHTLRINSVDNDLTALINSAKGTKYEMAIGSDISADGTVCFDRVPMKEQLDYEFTQGAQASDSAAIAVSFARSELPFVGNTGSEIAVNGAVAWNDDQTTETTSYLLKAVRDVEIHFDYELIWRKDKSTQGGVNLNLEITRNGSKVPFGLADGNGGTFAHLDITSVLCHGTDFTNSSSLPTLDPSVSHNEDYAIVNGIVWVAKYNGSGWYWQTTGKNAEEYFTTVNSGEATVSLKNGDVLRLTATLLKPSATVSTIYFVKSLFHIGWMSRGEQVTINALSPRRVARGILEKIVDGKYGIDVSFSDYDQRLSRTWLMAAESIRGISGAKFYSSFTEFCDWMSTVFGYVWYIGEPLPPKYTKKETCGQIAYDPWPYIDEMFNGPAYPENIIYMPAHARFFYHHRVGNDDFLYTKWGSSKYYNDPETGHPRTDTLFRITALSTVNDYVFDEYTGGYLYPRLYDHYNDYVGDDGKAVCFVHRSELLKATPVKRIPTCTDFQYSVDSAKIYSSVTIGYDKKDYDSINGRDEFNFNNTYTTGCSLSDKKLTLLSKYRADSYGIEFAVQKRGEDTTDTKSDNDVFFILCEHGRDGWKPDRTLTVENSITDAVFNAAFSPMACVRANAGYIGMQADELTLTFASSEGNSDIVIDGESMTDTIELDTPLATVGVLEFTTEEVDEAATDGIIEVEDKGLLYRGFLQEVDIRYTREEAAKYKIIVKEIEQ